MSLSLRTMVFFMIDICETKLGKPSLAGPTVNNLTAQRIAKVFTSIQYVPSFLESILNAMSQTPPWSLCNLQLTDESVVLLYPTVVMLNSKTAHVAFHLLAVTLTGKITCS